MTRNDFIAQVVQVQRDFEATGRRAYLIRAFRIGDLIIRSVEKKIYHKLQSSCMEAADNLKAEGAHLSSANLQTMYRIAVAFQEDERKIMLDKCVSVTDANRMTLMPRAAIMQSLAAHKKTTPFRLNPRTKHVRPKEDIPNIDSRDNPDCVVIQVADHGVIKDEKVIDVIVNVLSRVGNKSRAETLMVQAFRRLGW